MAHGREARFVLDVDVDDVEAEPIAGWVRDADAFERRFEGVLGLLAALDAAREAVVEARADAPRSDARAPEVEADLGAGTASRPSSAGRT